METSPPATGSTVTSNPKNAMQMISVLNARSKLSGIDAGGLVAQVSSRLGGTVSPRGEETCATWWLVFLMVSGLKAPGDFAVEASRNFSYQCLRGPQFHVPLLEEVLPHE